jgi:YcaO-like protein with predicted kinase domain
MQSVIKVYAGLSAQRNDIRALLPNAEVAPPVQRGDVIEDIDKEVGCILILDGVFHQSLSVCPSEIMDALRRGIRVFGASSMGALRAAELEAYGMVGVGKVFEYIRDSNVFRDDFVGQVFVDELPQVQRDSVTWVEFEINLRALHENGKISRATYEYLGACYAKLHYAERNLKTLSARIRSERRDFHKLITAATWALVDMERPKFRDARMALREVVRHFDEVARSNRVLRDRLNGAAVLRARKNGAGARVGVAPELGAAYSAIDLAVALARSETVSNRENGNRTARPELVLERLKGLMSLVGATRLAEISQLATHDLPVYQSTRPVPYGHTNAGTTTGSQGKGYSAVQSQISCLAEIVEGYCLEPKIENLIRGSYGFLRKHHSVADPRQFTRAIGVEPVRVREPLMWTEALWLEQKRPVLVPAEHVYYDFFPTDFGTRPIYPCSTLGAGAGSTPLEAVLHALYEVIESHYEANLESGAVRPQRLRYDAWKTRVPDGFKIRLYSVLLPGIQNLSYVYCLAELDDTEYEGAGCFSNPDIAMARAISEAMQAVSATYSGSREDLEEDEYEQAWDPEDYSPRSISYAEYKKRVISRRFDDLRSELRFLLHWLHAAGHPVTYVANMTRRGIEFPVVKAIVPGLMIERACRIAQAYSTSDMNRHRYGAG